MSDLRAGTPRFERRDHDPTVPARGHVAQLLDVDPDLGRYLSAQRWETARHELPVRIAALERGPWPHRLIAAAGAGHLGLLIVDGLVGRELLADDVASMELLGPGDLLRPWEQAADFELLRAAIRWSTLDRTRLALLDRQLAHRLAGHPDIHTALLERATARTRRLAVLHAISQLTRVDRRLLTLLWHLAERWGRVTPNGVHLPLTLSHRILGQLVGARRPTVSTAIGALIRTGQIARATDGTWLLTGSPVGAPAPQLSTFIPPRRPMLHGPGEALAL